MPTKRAQRVEVGLIGLLNEAVVRQNECSSVLLILFNLESAVELVERVVANGVIGVGKKFVVTFLVMRTFFP